MTIWNFVINSGQPQSVPALTVAQLLGAVVVGLGGGNILTQMAQRQAERLAKDNLTMALATMAKATGSLPPAAVPQTPANPNPPPGQSSI